MSCSTPAAALWQKVLCMPRSEVLFVMQGVESMSDILLRDQAVSCFQSLTQLHSISAQALWQSLWPLAFLLMFKRPSAASAETQAMRMTC